MKHTRLDRRTLLSTGAALAAPLFVPGLARAQAAERRFEPQIAGWRTFEVTTTVQVADVQGATQLWLPIPDITSDYQQSVDNRWSGNADTIGLTRESKHGVQMLHATFAASNAQPTVTLTSTLRTRNRAVDWNARAGQAEDPAVLKANLQPTELKPLDGIVRKTALEATKGATTDVDKVRALYSWVIANSWREPKTRGCGTGDIQAMLETGNLGGKCADLNAIFVGLCRAVGVPARDVYGLRLVPSAFGYKELGGNPANLKGAQHCRAEVYLTGTGWVAMDPADVLKVMRQETAEWIKDPAHPIVAPVMKGLFGSWEGNWVGWNTVNDLVLPGSADRGTKSFLMYPNGENASGRFDESSPDSFKYTISARELST
ncbi:transglutaminase-like domain-containing protein [Sphaerotilus mobilis]|uniref:Transglutaminase-like putative cysteine protease n=1 Tax=Sphaerotilus mobilis TaxID=47994 RepID=A0A4Q7LVJ5_9BURK|nr:transglutaminase-like domain-containing protein [Sphaerotilus mobilis]RZS58342.1 transglutaminase-like putative cysteine protease [Sphaerotilus mobilis]